METSSILLTFFTKKWPEKKIYNLHSNKCLIPGHSLILHWVVCLILPWQSLPPCFGEGFVQDRVLNIVPSPQDSEHSEYDDHRVNPPSTKMKKVESLSGHCFQVQNIKA